MIGVFLQNEIKIIVVSLNGKKTKRKGIKYLIP